MTLIAPITAFVFRFFPWLPLAQGEAGNSPFPITDTAKEFGPASVDFSWLFLKMIFAMVVVIALAVLLLRYVLPRITLSRSKGVRTDLQVLDRIPLDAKKALYVLQIEGRRFLISASENHIGLVTELEAKHEEKD